MILRDLLVTLDPDAALSLGSWPRELVVDLDDPSAAAQLRHFGRVLSKEVTWETALLDHLDRNDLRAALQLMETAPSDAVPSNTSERLMDQWRRRVEGGGGCLARLLHV